MENSYRRNDKDGDVPFAWCDRKDHAIVTHQDDMTKVDLPSFSVSASSDITRFRFDVSGHVNAITEECHVYSHELGCVAKSGGLIMETILLDHVLRCRGGYKSRCVR